MLWMTDFLSMLHVLCQCIVWLLAGVATFGIAGFGLYAVVRLGNNRDL